MTLLDRVPYPTGPSAFPVPMASDAELAFFDMPKVTDWWRADHGFNLGAGGEWRSVKRRNQADKTSGSRLIRRYGQMPTYAPTGGPNAKPALIWPAGQNAVFTATGIIVPTGLLDSFTLAAVYQPDNDSVSWSVVASTLGTRAVEPGVSWWGSTNAGVMRQQTRHSNTAQSGDNNVLETALDNPTGWRVVIWSRRGAASGTAADMITYYGKLAGGQMTWAASTIPAALNGLGNATLVVGGSIAPDFPQVSSGFSSARNFSLAELVVCQNADVFDDTTFLDRAAAYFFPRYFPTA